MKQAGKKQKLKVHPLKSLEDRRYLPRWEVENKVIYQAEGDTSMHEGQSEDLTICGTSLFDKYYLKKDQKLKLKLTFHDNVSLQVKGHVIWRKPCKHGGELVGISFDDINDKSREIMLEHAFEIGQDELIKFWVKH